MAFFDLWPLNRPHIKFLNNQTRDFRRGLVKKNNCGEGFRYMVLIKPEGGMKWPFSTFGH